MKSIKINSILNAFRMGLTVLVPLITFPYTSRIFLAEGTGKLNFCSSYTGVLALFASLGIYTYGIREGTIVRNDRNKLPRLSKELFIINSFSTIVSYLFFLVSLFLFSEINKDAILMLIYSINIISTGIGVDWIYGVEEDYVYITSRQIVMQLFQIVSLFIFVHSYNDIYIWAIITVCCSTVCNFVNIVHSRKYIDIFPLKIFENTKRISCHFKPVIILFSTQLASKVYTYIDTVVLGFMSSNYSVGIYSAAIKINSILITCIVAMYPVFMPKIIIFLEDDKEKFLNYIRYIFKILWAIVLPIVAGLIMVSNSVIYIVAGNGFNDAIVTMKILAPIILITTISNGIYSFYFIPQRKEKYVLYCTIVAAVINLIATLVLVPIYNENGAAFGSLISESSSLFLAIYYLSKFDSIKNVILPNVFNYILGTVAILIWCFVVNNLISNMYINLIISCVGGGLTYYLILKIKRDQLYYDFIQTIKKLTNKIGGKIQ